MPIVPLPEEESQGQIVLDPVGLGEEFELYHKNTRMLCKGFFKQDGVMDHLQVKKIPLAPACAGAVMGQERGRDS